jgi:hypothetical protein
MIIWNMRCHKPHHPGFLILKMIDFRYSFCKMRHCKPHNPNSDPNLFANGWIQMVRNRIKWKLIRNSDFIIVRLNYRSLVSRDLYKTMDRGATVPPIIMLQTLHNAFPAWVHFTILQISTRLSANPGSVYEAIFSKASAKIGNGCQFAKDLSIFTVTGTYIWFYNLPERSLFLGWGKTVFFLPKGR